MRKVVFIALSVLLLSSCRPISLMYVSPDGPPDFKLGWEDGCDTGLSAQGNYLYKAIYGYKKRPEMSENDSYKAGWNEGFTYCRFSIASDQSGN